jgi:hypothetical protein
MWATEVARETGAARIEGKKSDMTSSPLELLSRITCKKP